MIREVCILRGDLWVRKRRRESAIAAYGKGAFHSEGAARHEEGRDGRDGIAKRAMQGRKQLSPAEGDVVGCNLVCRVHLTQGVCFQ